MLMEYAAASPIRESASVTRRVKKLNRPTRASCRLLMIVAQQPTQSLAAPYRPFALPIVYPRKQQDITFPLMIPLGMEMVDIAAQCPPQGPLPEQDHLGQTLFLDRPDPALRIGIQVRAACRQSQRLNPTGCNDGTERSCEFGVAIVQEIATIPQRTTIVHGRVAGDLLHPWLIGMNSDPRDVYAATHRICEQQACDTSPGWCPVGLWSRRRREPCDPDDDRSRRAHLARRP